MMQIIHHQKGVAAIVFVIIFPFFFGFFALAIEGTRYLTDSAHLSDVAESASLAVAASVDHKDDRQRVKDYVAATIHDASISDNDITIVSQSCEQIYGERCGVARVYDKEGLRFNEYKVAIRSAFISWFPDSDLIHGFGENQLIANTAVARKYRQKFVDVVFVTDMSGSMLDKLGGQAKYAGVIDIIDSIMDTLDSYNTVAARQPDTTARNHVGVVPYSSYNQALTDNTMEDLRYDYLYNDRGGIDIDGPHSENTIQPSFTVQDLRDAHIDLHHEAPNGIPLLSDAVPDKQWMQRYLGWKESFESEFCQSFFIWSRCQNFRYTWPYDNWNYSRPSGTYGWNETGSPAALDLNKKIRNYIGCSNYTAGSDWRNNCDTNADEGLSPGYTGYFYNIELTEQFAGIKEKIANFFPSGSTSSSQGVIPAAQMLLNKISENDDNLIIVLSDGADNEGERNGGDYISYRYYSNHLCDYLRQQFTGKNQTLKIAVIGFDYDTQANPGLAMCADANEILRADTYSEIYNSILSLITEEIGHLYDHSYSADE